ncbi:MAG: FAD-binding protein [Planctomycetia bacterium]|nr:FAD-binding protein [Planctomycetia bacterium]
MLNPRGERIQDDLRGLLTGEVHCDTVFTELYATDASIYQVMPVGVVFPRTTMDVVATIRYAKENGLSIHPRGAGSGCVGGALGAGLILDFSKYMRRILTLGPNTVRVQAGVQLSRLNEFLRPTGRVFMPDSGNVRATTIGGMISVDGYGGHWISCGRPSDWLLGLEMVTADGTVISWSRNEKVQDLSEEISFPGVLKAGSAQGYSRTKRREMKSFDKSKAEKNRILKELRTLLLQNQDVIQKEYSQNVINKMGYRMNILDGETLDVAGLIAAAEGTLGVITSVTLQLQEIYKNRMTLLLLFESMEKATRAVSHVLSLHPNSCDLMDRRHIHFASERDIRFEVLFPLKTEAALLLDFNDKSRFSLYHQLRTVEDLLVRQKELAFQMIPAWDEEEAELFWSLANTFQPVPRWTHEGQTPIAVVEDVAVPPARLHEFILKTQEILRSLEMSGVFYAHAAQGQVRVFPLLDKANSDDKKRLLHFIQDYYRCVREMNGSFGAEFGHGLGRAFLLPRWQGKTYEISCKIKDIFDPEGIFHPGKLGTRQKKMPAGTENGLLSESYLRQVFRLLPQEKETEMVVREKKADALSVQGENEENAPISSDSESSRTNVLDSAVVGGTGESEASESTIFAMEKVRELVGEDPENYGTSDSYAYADKKIYSRDVQEEGEVPLLPVTEMGLEWNSFQLMQISRKCNGCGDCRGVQGNRMCPMFHVLFQEKASPRAKVNIIEGLISGELTLPELGGEEFHQIIRQCFQCHSCRVECAGNVDIPFLVRRAEEAWARARGLNFYESALVRLDRWAKFFHFFAPFVNLHFKSPWSRWMVEKIFGIASDRKLPMLEKRSFLEQMKKNNVSFPSDKILSESDSLENADSFVDREASHFFNLNQVLTLREHRNSGEPGDEIRDKAVYFVDTYANYFDVSLAWATKKVFDHNGIPLLVPQHQSGSGLSAVVLGRSDYAQKQILRNAALLADYVRQGYDVVLTEPAAVLAMKWEFPQIYQDNDDVLLISKHVYDACDYLWRYHLKRKLILPHRALPMRLGYHVPCRLRALNVGTPGANLLGLIPELEVVHAAAGCCGMGGTFGLLANNYNMSLRMGRKLHAWLRDPSLSAGVTECSACKMQMEQNSTKPTVHPIKILALVYGCMPEMEFALKAFAPELVLT